MLRHHYSRSAEAHDSQVFIELLRENSGRSVWADNAYWSEENELMLADSGYRSHLHHKGYRNKPLTGQEISANHEKSKTRARVEHVFGSQTNEQGGMLVRVIGLARATIKVGLMNLVYNMRRLVTLNRRAAPAT